MAQWICADHIERFQLVRFRRLHHLGQRESSRRGNTPPFCVKLAGIGHSVVPGKQIRIEAHVSRAARIGIIGQAYELCECDAGAELDQGSNIGGTNL